ncbi:MAG: biotin transporter BioY [Phycisphaeraceae bacterium]|nr:MAG: biotin transporter BioY [Phycisphaeraceae bacterium]
MAKARAVPRDHQAERDEIMLVALIRFAGVLLFPLLMALTSQLVFHLAIPLEPFGVPLTLQTLWVLLAALCIGPRLGMLSMLIYVVVGAVGVPVFAGGEAGLLTIFGQTGGYILGFIACQPVVAAIVRRPDRSVRGWGAMIAAVLAAHLIIFALGVPWLYVVRRLDPATPAISIADAIYGGLVIFVIPMLMKAGIAVLIGRWAAPWAARRIW